MGLSNTLMTSSEKHATLKQEPADSRWERIVHPQTGRFMFEYDPVRKLCRLVDRGKVATISLELVR